MGHVNTNTINPRKWSRQRYRTGEHDILRVDNLLVRGIEDYFSGHAIFSFGTHIIMSLPSGVQLMLFLIEFKFLCHREGSTIELCASFR